MPHPQIKFGTDGWRGVIADDFTFANVRTAAEAIAAYVHAQLGSANEDPAKGLCIGYDTHFGSKAFAHACAEVVAATGIPIALANDITPTPALSYGVRERGAAGGIMITSSHNPAQWNGVKYKAWYGGSGKPSIIAGTYSATIWMVASRSKWRPSNSFATHFSSPMATPTAAINLPRRPPYAVRPPQH
jgi:phosphomannomutase